MSERIEVLDRRRTMADQVYARLRRLIVALELTPGAPVPESDVSLRFGVSRTPVREALVRLANEGLVVVAPQIGTFVAPIDPDWVRQAQFLREHLEVAVSLKLCEMGPLDLAPARRSIQEQEALAGAHGFVDFIPVDDGFHQWLFETAGVGQLWSVIQAKKAHLDRIRVLHTPEPGKLQEVIAQHVEILDAIDAADPARAEAACRRHTRGALRYLEHLEATRSELFEPVRLTRQRRQPADRAAHPTR